MSATAGADLERALLRELLGVWHQCNQDDFAGRMRPPALLLHDDGVLGRFTPVRRTLSMQRQLCWSAPWGQVVEILRHEAAHQFVHEVLDITDETAHGPSFRTVCRERGIDARAAGLPTTVNEAEDRVVRRIRGLLALAGSDNPHEAEAAARAARRLLAQHDVSIEPSSGGFTFRQVGPIKARFDPWEKVLGGLLGQHFGVSVLYAQAYRPSRGTWGRVLEILGPDHHVEVAAYVHDVLRNTGERIWREHRRVRGLTGNKERRRFLYGVMSGFSESLATDLAPEETALVETDGAQMRAYVRQRYPRLRRGRAATIRVSDAIEHGRQAGRRIQVRPGVRADGRGPAQLPGPDGS